jgi:hypothetical protein
MVARDLRLRDAATSGMLDQHGRPGAAGEPGVAPSHERQDDRIQVATLVGEVVVRARGVLLVRATLDQAVLDEGIQPVDEDVSRDPEAVSDLIEPLPPKEEVPDDEEGPPLSDHLEPASHGAG